MKKLNELFDRVVVINCQHRPDRLDRFVAHVNETGIADLDELIIYSAVIGDFVTAPSDWGSGNGAWGCLRSHQRVLEDTMHVVDDRYQMMLDSVLVLEDDVVFLEGALEGINRFMGSVPDDWGQIYLGGQHRLTPEKTDVEDIVIGTSVNRTHAYAVNRSVIQKVYRHICFASDYKGTVKHVDHQLELAHNRKDWPVYCPVKWFCGQEEGRSNVSGKLLQRMTWQLGESRGSK